MDKQASVFKLKKIFEALSQHVKDAHRFENAAYDCFEGGKNLESMMAAFQYFLMERGERNLECSTNALSKRCKMSKDDARVLAEIWLEALGKPIVK